MERGRGSNENLHSIGKSTEITSEAIRRAQAFAEKVVSTFEKNNTQKEVLKTFDALQESIFTNPIMFEAFLDKAYTEHSINISNIS